MPARLFVGALTIVAVALAGCGSGGSSGTGGGGGGSSTLGSKTIDPSKAETIPIGSTGAYLKVPAGALANATTISILDTGAKAPDGSPIYRFLPEGTRFQKDVEVQLDVPPGMPSPTIWWSNDAAGTSYFPLNASKPDGLGHVVGWVGHFSTAYVAPQAMASFVFNPTTVNCSFLGQSVTVNVAALGLAVADRAIANACTAALDACGVTAYRNMETIVIGLGAFSTNGTAQLVTGEYPIVSPTDPAQAASVVAGGKVASIAIERTNASCGLTTAAPLVAKTGTIHLEALTPSLIELEYTGVTFSDGSAIPDGEFIDHAPCTMTGSTSQLLQSMMTTACTTGAPACPAPATCQ